jgi:uncharacterized protein YegL
MPFKGQKRSKSADQHATLDTARTLTSWLGEEAAEAEEPPPDGGATEDNRAPRVLVAGVFDRSGSVSSHAAAIDQGVLDLTRAVSAHAVARWCVELSLAYIGQPPHVEPFRPATGFVVPEVVVAGTSPYGTTLDRARAELVRRRDALAAAGIEVNRAVAVVVGDGQPNSEDPGLTARAVEAWQALQAKDSLGLVCFPVCVGAANEAFMAGLSVANKPKQLRGFNFLRELFFWLSQAVIAVSVSQPGEAVRMPPTDAWSA